MWDEVGIGYPWRDEEAALLDLFAVSLFVLTLVSPYQHHFGWGELCSFS